MEVIFIDYNNVIITCRDTMLDCLIKNSFKVKVRAVLGTWYM